MKSTVIFLIASFYLIAESHAGPIETKKRDILDGKDVIYTGQHEIVKIYTSIALMEELQKRIVFFVEADINNDGSKVSKGLYVIIDNSTTKLLTYGHDIAGDATGKVFFAAKDGVYTYDKKENNAHKYGDLTENIISLAVENNTGVVYALTSKRKLVKITENGSKSDVDDRVKHAREISLDKFDNLYYYDVHKNVYVVSDQGIKKIEGLPMNTTSIKLTKPPLDLEGVFFITDDVPYTVYPNGTSVKSEDTSLNQIKPTAFSIDALIVLYFGREKKIYEINLIEKVVVGIFDGISDWVKKNLSFLGIQ